MKKFLAFMILLLIPFSADAEKIFKTSFMITNGKAEGHEFTLFSWELKLEWSLYRNLSLGAGFRKETNWRYSGYYLSLYPIYKIPLSERLFLNTGLGAEYGIASSEYDSYQVVYDQNDKIVFHKWIYLIGNISLPGDSVKGNTGIIYPFATISGGVWILKWLSVEMGIKAQMLKFWIKSYDFVNNNAQDRKFWEVVPSAFIQIGIKLPDNKKIKAMASNLMPFSFQLLFINPLDPFLTFVVFLLFRYKIFIASSHYFILLTDDIFDGFCVRSGPRRAHSG